MDKKNLTIGLLLLVSGFALMTWHGQKELEYEQQRLEKEQLIKDALESGQDQTAATTFDAAPEQVADPANALDAAFTPAPSAPAATQSTTNIDTPDATPANLPEQTTTLENEFIRVTFTNKGAAIKQVELIAQDTHDQLIYPEAVDTPETPFSFNHNNPTPALAISRPGASGALVTLPFVYEVEKQSRDSVTYRVVTPQGLEFHRTYTLLSDNKGAKPYTIAHKTEITNHTESTLPLDRLFFSAGGLPPTEGDSIRQYLSFAYYNAAENDADFAKVVKAPMMGIFGQPSIKEYEPTPYPTDWAAVKNQFFTAIITPAKQAVGYYPEAYEAVSDDKLSLPMRQGVTGHIEFDLGQVIPGGSSELAMDYYIGPKEFARLETMGKQQDQVMEFGFFGFMSKLLLVMLKGLHNFIVPFAENWAWGITIILLTLIIKTILWPLTSIQVRSSKRMQKISQPMQELREKYKDDPQTLQKKTLELFKENKVNPAAGCLPLFIQMPIFIGLFFMLRTASELRFAEFLWIKDLSSPEHLAYIAGFPINILPVVMAVTMFFQMRMVPSPSTDNMQRKIFQLMPFIFLLICYNFSSGLVLYWTVQNLFTIFQSWVIYRKIDETTAITLPSESDKTEEPAKKKTTTKSAPHKRKTKRNR